MNKRLLKEKELNLAVDKMEMLGASVKNLTKSVKQGTVTKAELQQEIETLQEQSRKVKLLSAESKVFGEWVTMNEAPPKLL